MFTKQMPCFTFASFGMLLSAAKLHIHVISMIYVYICTLYRIDIDITVNSAISKLFMLVSLFDLSRLLVSSRVLSLHCLTCTLRTTVKKMPHWDYEKKGVNMENKANARKPVQSCFSTEHSSYSFSLTNCFASCPEMTTEVVQFPGAKFCCDPTSVARNRLSLNLDVWKCRSKQAWNSWPNYACKCGTIFHLECKSAL